MSVSDIKPVSVDRVEAEAALLRLALTICGSTPDLNTQCIPLVLTSVLSSILTRRYLCATNEMILTPEEAKDLQLLIHANRNLMLVGNLEGVILQRNSPQK